MLPEPLPPNFEPMEVMLLDSLPEGVWFSDREGIIRYWSRGAEAITGFLANEILGTPFRTSLSYCDETGEPTGEVPMGQTQADHKERKAHLFLLHKEGHRIAVQVETAPMRSATRELLGTREIIRESPEKAGLLRRGKVLSQYQLWDENIESASEEYMRRQLELRLLDGSVTGAILIEIDHLSDQHRNMGREAKDAVLAMVSRTTLLCMRFSDISGRWGDDSILAIMEASTIGNLETAAERMRALIASSGIKWWGQVVKITVTIACTMFEAGDTAESVVARLALGAAAGSKVGGNRVLRS